MFALFRENKSTGMLGRAQSMSAAVEAKFHSRLFKYIFFFETNFYLLIK